MAVTSSRLQTTESIVNLATGFVIFRLDNTGVETQPNRSVTGKITLKLPSVVYKLVTLVDTLVVV